MIIQMKLLEDVIFGNGQSIPGEEDISVLRDIQGFPYFKGSTFKGIFREELERLLKWKNTPDVAALLKKYLGEAGNDDLNEDVRFVFHDFAIADSVKQKVLQETTDAHDILACFTSIRTFTQIESDGIVKDGSLRIARCVNRGISLFGEVECSKEDEALLGEVLAQIKWVGTMRNRGFGKVDVYIA